MPKGEFTEPIREFLQFIEKGTAESPEDFANGEWVDQLVVMLDKMEYSTFPYLYAPSQRLIEKLDLYELVSASDASPTDGKLLEEIALLAFASLRGARDFRSFQSYGPQIDLIVSGDGAWKLFLQAIGAKNLPLDVLIESKDTSHKVNDAQFLRVCGLMEFVFSATCGIGIFFSRAGATGFPDSTKRQRKRVLSDSQATQIIYYAKSRKPVVVFDRQDILSLRQPGSLPFILKRKLTEIEQWTGLSVSNSVDAEQVDLPSHLAQHIDALDHDRWS